MASQGIEPRRGGMTPERWRRVGELFHQALELSPGERTLWAERACEDSEEMRRELLSLLESDRAAAQGFVHERMRSAMVAFHEATSGAMRLLRAGPYRLVKELGRGGMGTVYLAERDDEHYQTTVAVKLVRPGMDTPFVLQRFRKERQILAQLQHPNIARLLDGGTTEEGLPYIVMEYIDGPWITAWCETRTLSLRRRIELFLEVCSAVEYAHRQFLVHRDLKPGNILVDPSGVPKLLDFGICKVLNGDSPALPGTSETVGQMGTPDYASPEQIRSDLITVASDIYSLAAVLYELLTGVKAHRFDKLTPQAIERVICDVDVVRPSAVAASKLTRRRLAGDLDNIVMRGLDKDPNRRYASVEQLSEDLRRFLAFQPVLARPNTVAYRMGKFIRRERTGVAAGAAISITLAMGAVVSLREARQARQNLSQVRHLANTFVLDVHNAIRYLPESIRARRMILETELRYLDKLADNSGNDAAFRAELAQAYLGMGEVQEEGTGENLGNSAEALKSYRRALSLLDPASGPKGRLTRMTVLRRLGGVRNYMQETAAALEHYREAERLGETLPAQPLVRRELAEIHLAVGETLRLAGDNVAAMVENLKALALIENASPSDRGLRYTLANTYSALGATEVRAGRLREGLARYRQALAGFQSLVKLEPANTSYQHELVRVWSFVGDVLGNPNLRNLDDIPGAIQAYREMLEAARHMHETDRTDQRAASDYAIALTRLAAVTPENRIGRLRESIDLLAGIRRVSPLNTTNLRHLAHGHLLVGDALTAQGDRAGAVRSYREGLQIADSLWKDGLISSAQLLVHICHRLVEEASVRADHGSATAYARQALDVSEHASVKQRPLLLPRAYSALALAAADRNEAVKWFERSLAGWRAAREDPDFGPPQAKEMLQVESALKK